MNPNSLNGFNLVKIITSLNRVLNIANKAIPLYNQFKPILKNTNTLTNMLNIINSSDNNLEKNKDIDSNEKLKKVSNNNLPTFFQ